MSASTTDDSCMSTDCGLYSEQTLLMEEKNNEHLHSSVPTAVFSVHDSSPVCLQHSDKFVPNNAYKTSPQMMNNIGGRNINNNLDQKSK